jgi:DNA-binding Xre family transcriptional regulator
MSKVALGFVPDTLRVALDKLLPSRKTPTGLVTSYKYRQILASMGEIGLIEPLSVTPANPETGQHLLLDGHIRLIALRELGHTEATCLIAKDDESYTYNTRVNRISTIQEHYMIRRAIDRGVSPTKLAKTLGIDVSLIHKKASLLEGICAEATELLQDRHFTTNVSRVLRQMKPIRQVECVELMISANNLTTTYADALLAATQPDMLVEGKKLKKRAGITQEQMSRMEREMANVQGQYKLAEQTFGQDVLNLVLARGYLAKLLENKAVGRFLKQRHADVLEQFENIVQATSLEA